MALGLKQALITHCNHPPSRHRTVWVVFLYHRDQVNELEEFRVPGCLLWELEALRETPPPLVSDTLRTSKVLCCLAIT